MPIDALTEARINALEIVVLDILRTLAPEMERIAPNDTAAILRFAQKLLKQREVFSAQPK